MAKRRVNIEVCSEVVDLIMDIANEAYDRQLKTNKMKIDKPLWRDWMNVFKEG